MRATNPAGRVDDPADAVIGDAHQRQSFLDGAGPGDREMLIRTGAAPVPGVVGDIENPGRALLLVDDRAGEDRPRSRSAGQRAEAPAASIVRGPGPALRSRLPGVILLQRQADRGTARIRRTAQDAPCRSGRRSRRRRSIASMLFQICTTGPGGGFAAQRAGDDVAVGSAAIARDLARGGAHRARAGTASPPPATAPRRAVRSPGRR